MYERALQGYEKAWGPEHTSTLDTVNNLGNLYADQSKLAEAEQMYERALQGYEKAWGPEHTSTLNTVNNLGNLYADQGKLAEAEQMYKRALQGKEKVCGPEHTSTLDAVNNLANLYKSQGKLAEAEKMYERALQGYEKACGPEHTSTLRTVNNLGNFYVDQGKLAEAEKMYWRAIHGYERTWGSENTLTLNTVDNLGLVFQKRCYAAAKLSARSSVLAYVKQLARICLKFPHSRLNLFDYVGRAFAWIGDDEKAAAAFAHQLALCSPEYNACCDGCGINLSVNTDRLVCTFCEDGDLCRSCFDRLESYELGVISPCHGHTFLDIEGTSLLSSSLTDNVNTSVSIQQWLKEIADL